MADAEKKAPAKKPAAKKTAAAPAATEGAGGTLKVHHLRPAPGAKTAKTRVGGQMPLHMRLPKLRGFKNPFRTEYQVVNLEKLGALYPEGGKVTVEDLVAKGAVRGGQLVKVLGTGEITVKLDVTVDALSASAKDKILAAGGSVSDS